MGIPRVLFKASLLTKISMAKNNTIINQDICEWSLQSWFLWHVAEIWRIWSSSSCRMQMKWDLFPIWTHSRRSTVLPFRGCLRPRDPWWDIITELLVEAYITMVTTTHTTTASCTRLEVGELTGMTSCWRYVWTPLDRAIAQAVHKVSRLMAAATVLIDKYVDRGPLPARLVHFGPTKGRKVLPFFTRWQQLPYWLTNMGPRTAFCFSCTFWPYKGQRSFTFFFFTVQKKNLNEREINI